ncbi:MAG: DUF1273 domain-containing protein [Oscillospiraceae bacterium]|nr:DUF1273 domain-containing protein [Oscillospiraceae bacterium]
MDIQNCCAFTGHRPAHFHFKYDEQHPDCVELKTQMKSKVLALIAQGVTTYLSGMALGVDIWGAEIVLELKKQYPQLLLIAVMPCETQAQRWSIKQRERYYNIRAQCDEDIFVSHRYTPECMHKRNHFLVNHAAHLLAVYDGGGKGGTAYTVDYAKQKNRNIIIIPAECDNKIIDFWEAR